jgi:Arc/MetJ-type ribon-helix-helix transcriptional regulator
MPRITVSLSEERASQIEDFAGRAGPHDSKSEVVRSFISRAEEADELEAENDRLRRERRQLLEQREEHGELVRYADEQREQERRRRRRQKQPVWTRAKWWVLGEPD